MSPPLRPDAPLSPRTLGALVQSNPREQYEFFRAHPDEPFFDAWLLSQLEPPTPSSQALLRLARQAHGYWDGADGNQHLLIGIPLVLQAVPLSLSWAPMRYELEGALASALLPLGAKVTLASNPLSADVLHNIGASQLGAWCEALFCGTDPSQGLYDPGTTGPAVWVGQVSVPREQRADLERLLFTVNPEISHRVSALNMRMEAIAEEAGVKLRMFPVTAYWNSLSLARLVDARLRLAVLKKQPGPWSATRAGSSVVVRHGRAERLKLEFPEELDSDIVPLFRGWVEFPSAVSA